MTEKQKMLRGDLYDPLAPELVRARTRCRDLLARLNRSAEEPPEERRAILDALFGAATDVWLQPPFYCDYGSNLRLGKKVFFNFNCVVLDVMPVEIGDGTLVGPAVQIYTAMHPLDAGERRSGLEYAQPVRIGADVWIGGGAIICPGVRIGNRSVVGAGAVVTRDVPDDVVVAGNPAPVLERATQEMQERRARSAHG